jgi:hypothetical protein
MPYTYRIDPALQAVFATAEGIMTDDELVRVEHEMAEDPLFHPGLRLLCDWTGVTQSRISQASIAYAASSLRFSPSARCAYVARHGPETQVVVYYTVYSGRMGASNIGIFQSRSEAVSWLNQGVPEAQRIP